jgi:hypothetical protein
MTRCKLTITIFGLLALTFAMPALAQSSSSDQGQRDYCPARPGLGTPACTIASGRVSIETGIADWTRDDNADERSDALLIGDTLVRIGLGDALEAQLGWTPFGHLRTRDKATGAVDKADRVGDVLVGLKANLRQPDGSGFSVAVQPFATLPVGRGPLGAGDWGAGVVVPVSFDLSPALNLQLSPEVDAATDEDRHGRHLAYGSVVGLGVSLSDAVGVTFEVAATRDDDPEGHTTEAYGAVSTSWTPSDDLQLDMGTNLGLNHNAADVEVYVGISRQL